MFPTPLEPALPSDVLAFRARFPEFTFDTVSDPDIKVALDTALLWIDSTSWAPNDYTLAVNLWAAHFLTLQLQQRATVMLGGSGWTDLYIRAISFGERHLVFAQRQDAKGASNATGPGEQLFETTIYGQMYLQLRTRNITAVLVV